MLDTACTQQLCSNTYCNRCVVYRYLRHAVHTCFWFLKIVQCWCWSCHVQCWCCHDACIMTASTLHTIYAKAWSTKVVCSLERGVLLSVNLVTAHLHLTVLSGSYSPGLFNQPVSVNCTVNCLSFLQVKRLVICTTIITCGNKKISARSLDYHAWEQLP